MSAIRNLDRLARSTERADALAILQAGLDAIDTARVIEASFSLSGSELSIRGERFDLSSFDRITILGVGKASCDAIAAIEPILKGHVTRGLALDVRPGVCDISDVYEGTHPHPSPQNVAITEKIVDMANGLTERDLVIVVVSGGGSALLCYPAEECDQGTKLYQDLLHTGASIVEMNTVRKHISQVKGGGFAKLLFPATVVGLIFCDIPGDDFANVASGPTYLDASTVADAQAVLDKYQLSGYTLSETPKEAKYFERVRNIPLVSNGQALDAMAKKAESLGYAAVSIGSARYDDAADIAARLAEKRAHGGVVLAGGEPSIKTGPQAGKGGRCTHAALAALPHLIEGDVFIAFASDGRDNCDAAGAIADASTLRRAQEKGLDQAKSLAIFDSYPLFEATDDLLMTGPTGANVSDLFLLLTKKV